MTAPRRLLARLRDLMASERGPPGKPGKAALAAQLHEVARLVAAELVAEVCSIYAMRPGDLLELVASEGLRPEAVGRTRLRVGEGVVGMVAATGAPLNLPDAQRHPNFAYRPETGEDPFVSLLAVPVRRAGRTLGVIAVQNRVVRRYADDEIEVLETVAMLLAEVLAAAGTRDGAEEGIGATLPRQFKANVLSPGLVIGPALLRGSGTPPRRFLADDPAAELARVTRATEAMRRELDELIEAGLLDMNGAPQGGTAPREVLEATRLLAADSFWLRRIAEVVRGGLSAEAAVHRVMGELRNRMRRISDPYLRERLADLEDLALHLLNTLDGAAGQPSVPPGAILMTRRLGPSQLLEWHGRGIAGFAIEEASPAGHAAIIARALGLPALGGARGMLEAYQDGDRAVLDADEGQLILRPEAEVVESYTHALDAKRLRRAAFAEQRDSPAMTRDGTRLRLMLNVGLTLELDQLDATGADGIGLFRTEIAMLARGRMVESAEQVEIYHRILDAAGDRPVLFRTLDLGGDKLLPGAAAPEEENPAMGWRSLRIALDRPLLLRRQLHAMLVAAAGRDLSVMFPMVATLAEFRAARQLLLAEAARLEVQPRRLAVGSMLEVPALLWQLPALLEEADFLSIGSNDLMQFLFAADRGTPSLSGRYDFLSAPVLDILEAVRRQAREAGRPVSICGEAASRPLEAMVLAALGYDTLSMPAGSLPPLKEMLRQLDLAAFRPLLASLRRNAARDPSLREPIASWARERGLVV